MFDLTITHEVNELLKQVRKELRNTEYFIKGNLVFELERDLEHNTITTRLHYNGKEHKEIRLADISSLA